MISIRLFVWDLQWIQTVDKCKKYIVRLAINRGENLSFYCFKAKLNTVEHSPKQKKSLNIHCLFCNNNNIGIGNPKHEQRETNKIKMKHSFFVAIFSLAAHLVMAAEIETM